MSMFSRFPGGLACCRQSQEGRGGLLRAYIFGLASIPKIQHEKIDFIGTFFGVGDPQPISVFQYLRLPGGYTDGAGGGCRLSFVSLGSLSVQFHFSISLCAASRRQPMKIFHVSPVRRLFVFLSIRHSSPGLFRLAGCRII